MPEQQSVDMGARDIAVPQPSGSTKECDSFPVNVQDDSDEEDGDGGDDDISSGMFP